MISSLIRILPIQSRCLHSIASRAMIRREFSSYLVPPKEFNGAYQEHLQSGSGNSQGSNQIIPVCASWFLPNDPEKRTGKLVFEQGHIPGARFFDLDEIKDPSSPYPHMLPSASAFTSAMSKMGISNNDTIVVYDSKELGIFSAPRVAWTFSVFGHKNVHVLNNYRIYVQQGFPTEEGSVESQAPKAETQYEASDSGLKAVVDFNYMKELATGHAKHALPQAIVLDARPKGRFDGTADEPRPGLPSGHMPRSTSMPFSDLLDPQTKAFLSSEQLQAIFRSKGVPAEGPIISSCGTGVSAAVIDAALSEAGYPLETRLLYDGSWTEWAQRAKPDENLILKST